MYLAREDSTVYHPIPESSDHTVCGLRASFRVAAYRRGVLIGIAIEPPEGRTLCRHCVALMDKAEHYGDLKRRDGNQRSVAR